MFKERIEKYGSFIRFSHTIFALPFVVAIVLLSVNRYPVSLLQIVWVLVAVVSARSAAMAFNRLVDREVDAKNPRTAGREIPAGVIGVGEAWIFCGVASGIFLLSAWGLGRQCFFLAPLVLAVLLGYSYTKRFTPYSHLVLGIALALAPGGAWLALTGEWSWLPVSLMVAVLFWVAGFDIIYSCQDYEFDRENHLYSFPAQFGVERSLLLAKGFHLLALLLLLLFGVTFHFGIFYYLCITGFGIFLLRQHQLVTPSDLSQVNQAFFVQNGLASLLFLVAVAGEVGGDLLRNI